MAPPKEDGELNTEAMIRSPERRLNSPMRRLLVNAVAAGAVAAAAVLGWGSAAGATTVVEQGTVIPVPVQFDGIGTGSTAEEALGNAVADAVARAAAEGFTDCAILGDPIIVGLVQPGFPVSYLAQVTIGCTG
jgi:hypothetical protein